MEVVAALVGLLVLGGLAAAFGGLVLLLVSDGG
jgi:hypothetical protein